MASVSRTAPPANRAFPQSACKGQGKSRYSPWTPGHVGDAGIPLAPLHIGRQLQADLQMLCTTTKTDWFSKLSMLSSINRRTNCLVLNLRPSWLGSNQALHGASYHHRTSSDLRSDLNPIVPTYPRIAGRIALTFGHFGSDWTRRYMVVISPLNQF